MRWLVRYFLGASLSVALCCLSFSNAEALPAAWKKSFTWHAMAIHKKHPPYVWGGIDDKKGVDCSGLVWLAAKRAGIPGITRTTSKNMALGFNGYTGVDIDGMRDGDEGDLPFWSWRDQPKRPYGHVGIFLVSPKSRLLEVLHASSSRRTTNISRMEGIFVRDLAKTKRLTIGDPIGTKK